jgi:septal ring factor EnvC (AmiA/AmiB activator)
MMLKKNLLLLAFAFASIVAAAQPSKDELQKQQQQLQKEIADLNKTLSAIKSNKKRSLGELTAVRRKIAAREAMVSNISRDLRRLDDNIYAVNLDIYRYSRELDTLKRQYAQSLVFAYKNRSNYDYLNFIFSANSFNDAIKRVEYLKSYRKQRETQLNTILKTQQVLEQKKSTFQSSIQEKNMALQEQSKTLKELENDRKEKDKVVAGLKSQESELSSEIKKKDRERRDMANAISAIIKREIAAARKKEEEERKKAAAANVKPAPTTNTNSKPTTGPATTGVTTNNRTNRSYDPLESTPEGLERSLNFENNKGRLPWPVDAGYVSGQFGTHAVEGTRIMETNDGIRIEMPQAGASVKSVADGEVSSIFDLGGEIAVVVKHGKYFTTYSHLSSVSVSKGAQVRAGTVLGKAAANDNGVGEILFMVSAGRGFVNPESWLKRR